jgi:hypothetical protein
MLCSRYIIPRISEGMKRGGRKKGKNDEMV